ncbi:NfeD family protein [Deinococcus cellulosilyticus]|uniref:Uncharacterized protein n=1 Tax=Deinococcus cellulosilyticus (strain DSM 18568 / NBRC 106333 / KACC 11606 / 5516J-15) TaxID=1223518 RepID=A0A511N4L1_DEIC1|nr:NfeD family protein [Deinococcus cellulosilyticus]GEM47800.1 hypothetical protein DC3_34350 [Deinococcus cellulosilyticus NBRC 106333 = KACC 11606]
MIFWLCLLIGGALILVSLLFQHDSTVDAGSPDLHDVFSWLNLRAVVFAVAFFGLGGVIASRLGLNMGGQWVFALITGLSVGITTAWLFRYARQQEFSGQVGDLVGRTGKVIVPPRPEHPGKVMLTVSGQVTEFHAHSSDLLQVGEPIIVVGVEQGTLNVRRWHQI